MSAIEKSNWLYCQLFTMFEQGLMQLKEIAEELAIESEEVLDMYNCWNAVKA